MEFIKSKHGLILPKQTGLFSMPRDFSIQAVDNWRSHLPLSNVAASAKALYEFSQDLHQARLEANERFTILSHLRPTLSYLGEILAKLYAEREVLTEKQQLIAELVIALHFEMLNGYKLVMDSALSSFITKRKLFTAALYNAMVCCEKILFDAYKHHRDPHSGIWHEFHILYLLAKSQKVNHKSLSNRMEWHSRFNTIDELYKNCLLFVIANPYRLTKTEVNNLIYALEVWAPLLILKPVNENATGLYIVDMDVDQPPLYTVLHPKPSHMSFMLILDKITLRLEKLLQDKTTTGNRIHSTYFLEAEQMLPLGFIESLLSSWQYVKERVQKREKSQGTIQVCLGISTCHWFISEQLSTNTNIFDKANQDFQVIDLSIDQQGQNAQSYRCYDCQLIDQSEGGYCLEWTEEIPQQLQCGEIIALQHGMENAHKTWTVGTIRWLRHEKDHSILIGIQILSNDVLAVYSRVDETKSHHQTATLLLAEEPLHHKPQTLITPSLPFKVGQEVQIHFESKDYQAILQKNYSLSPCYQQFGVEFLYEQLEIPKAKVKIKSLPTTPPL